MADLLEDASSIINASSVSSISMSSNELTNTAKVSTNRQQQQQLTLVGQQFWELAEGDEFSVYIKYANCVTNFNRVKFFITLILNNAEAVQLLQQTSPGLVEISKYLLPKLLLSSIYHFLYLAETVEYLQQHATDEEDKTLLVDTLDTFKAIKYELSKLGFAHSKGRLIETSFRLFTVANINLNSHLKQTLITNIYTSTLRKLDEIQSTVEALKLPVNIIEDQVNVRNPYLYEGGLAICRMSQPVNFGSSKISAFISSQPKLKTSKRYAYLFDGLLILIKKMLIGKVSSRFKQCISLDKCILKDLDDELCFELHIVNANSRFNTGGGGTQDLESIVFITEQPSDKWQWMSMLCYSQYKCTIERLLQAMTEEQNKENPLPIPCGSYVFDQPDSPETILFEQAAPNQSERHVNPYVSSDGLSVRAATLVKLIERLTHHLYPDPKFSHTFLMCFREFCSTHQLLSLLSQRYDVPDLYLNQTALDNYAKYYHLTNQLLIFPLEF